MAKLTARARKKLPATVFAEPGQRKYPVNNLSHARNALARVSQFGSAAEKSTVRRKVKARFPSIG